MAGPRPQGWEACLLPSLAQSACNGVRSPGAGVQVVGGPPEGWLWQRGGRLGAGQLVSWRRSPDSCSEYFDKNSEHLVCI